MGAFTFGPTVPNQVSTFTSSTGGPKKVPCLASKKEGANYSGDVRQDCLWGSRRKLIRWNTSHCSLFAGFLRYDEVSPIQQCDVMFSQSILLFISPKVRMINSAKLMKWSWTKNNSLFAGILAIHIYCSSIEIGWVNDLVLAIHPIVAGQTPTLWGSGKIFCSRISELIKKLAKLGYPAVDFNSCWGRCPGSHHQEIRLMEVRKCQGWLRKGLPWKTFISFQEFRPLNSLPYVISIGISLYAYCNDRSLVL